MGAGRALFYIGCIALFGGIRFAIFLQRVLVGFGIVTGARVATIGHLRHLIFDVKLLFPPGINARFRARAAAGF